MWDPCGQGAFIAGKLSSRSVICGVFSQYWWVWVIWTCRKESLGNQTILISPLIIRVEYSIIWIKSYGNSSVNPLAVVLTYYKFQVHLLWIDANWWKQLWWYGGLFVWPLALLISDLNYGPSASRLGGPLASISLGLTKARGSGPLHAIIAPVRLPNTNPSASKQLLHLSVPVKVSNIWWWTD